MEAQDYGLGGSYKMAQKDRTVFIEWLQLLVKRFPADPECPKYQKLLTGLKAGSISMEDFFYLENVYGPIYEALEKNNPTDGAILEIMEKIEPLFAYDDY